MASDVSIAAVLGSLYEVVLDETAWPNALGAMARAFEAGGVSLIHMDANDGQVLSLRQTGHDPASQWAYAQYFHRLDPTVSAAASARVSEWVKGPDWLNPNRPSNSEYVNDYCRLFDIRWIAGAKLLSDDSGITYFSLQRGYRARPFDVESQHLFEQLRPHLARTLALCRVLGEVTQTGQLQQAMLDASPYALMVVDKDLRLLHKNDAADRLMRLKPEQPHQTPPLRVRHGRLRWSGEAAQERTEHAARAACGPYRGDASARCSEWQVICGDRAFHLRASPLPPASRSDASQRPEPAALLWISEPRAESFDPTSLTTRFGLTRSESELLAALMCGVSPVQWAHHRGVRIGTVRSQLHALFQKTGASNQAALVALGRALPPTLAIPSNRPTEASISNDG